MIKFATAIRVGTASAEAILRRFTRNATHPVYQAMAQRLALSYPAALPLDEETP